jgi:zinc protease
MNRHLASSTRLAVFTAILAALVGTAGAADAPTSFPATPPAPGPAPRLDIPTPDAQRLPNGLEVVSVRRAGLPLVTAQLVLRRGGELDPVNQAGLADLTANLLARGAGGQSAPQIAAAAEALGGSLQAAAGWDESSLGITVTTPMLPKALTLLATVVRHPDFAPAELARAKAQATDQLRLSLSQPLTLAALAADRAVFGAGAYGHSRTGTPASIARITRADVERLHAELYRPDNAILVLAGDITPAQALQLATASFGDWKQPATPLPPRPRGSADGKLPAVLVIDQHGAGQAGVVAAHAIPARKDASYYTGVVANAVLGGSYSARLNEEIRIKRGLSYGASSRLQPLADTGLWLAAAQTKNASAPQVVALMRQQFAALGKADVPAAELAARKATLAGDYARSLETTAGLAREVADLAVYRLPLGDINQYITKVQAVTPKEVATYARKHLDPRHTHVVVVGDASQFGPAMHEAYPDAATLQAGTLDLDGASLQAPPTR